MQKRRKTKGEGNEFTKKIDKFVSNKLLEIRLNKGMTRTQLCEKIDVTNQQVQKYESGKNRITIGRLVLIANTLEEPISTFCKDNYDDVTEHALLGLTDYQKSCHELLQNFKKIRSVEQQKLIKDMIANLIKKQGLRYY